MRKIAILLFIVLLVLSSVPVYAEGISVETKVVEIEKYGNLKLELAATEAEAAGIEAGDIVTVQLMDQAYDMPVAASYNDVDQGAFICRLVVKPDRGEDYVILAINMEDLATWAGIATRTDMEEDPGYRWQYHEGVPDPLPVTISLKEKGGYGDQLELHSLVRSDKREDYPNLDDAAYANFRAVATPGMGRNALFRSSSPIRTKMNRNKEADAAAKEAGIRTIINMADSEGAMRAHGGYDGSYYSTQTVLCLNMVMSFQSEEFRSALAKAFTFMGEQEGPFLIHCVEGKDRAGFACAVLEAFMGADEDAVVADYMVTYYNFYGVEPGTELYTKLADANIRRILAQAFGLESLEGADLQQAAEAYLREIGMTEEAVAALREKLSRDY